MEHIQLIMNDAHRLLLLQFALSISHGKSTKYKTNRAFKQVYLLLVIEYLYTYRFKIQNGSEVYKKKNLVIKPVHFTDLNCWKIKLFLS